MQTAKGIVPNICTLGSKNFRESVGAAAVKEYNSDAASEKYHTFFDKYATEHDSEELPVFRFLCTAPFEQSAKRIVQSWQMNFGTGFEVKISVLSLEELNEQVESGAYDGAILPIGAESADAAVFLKQFSVENEFRFSNADFNRLMNSDKEEMSKCREAENMLIKQGVVYPLFTSGSYYVQRKGISGIYFYAFGGKVNFLHAERVK